MYPNACCNVPDNLVTAQEHPDLVVKTCQVCGCRHREWTVERGELKAEGRVMGRPE